MVWIMIYAKGLNVVWKKETKNKHSPQMSSFDFGTDEENQAERAVGIKLVIA